MAFLGAARNLKLVACLRECGGVFVLVSDANGDPDSVKAAALVGGSDGDVVRVTNVSFVVERLLRDDVTSDGIDAKEGGVILLINVVDDSTKLPAVLVVGVDLSGEKKCS